MFSPFSSCACTAARKNRLEISSLVAHVSALLVFSFCFKPRARVWFSFNLLISPNLNSTFCFSWVFLNFRLFTEPSNYSTIYYVWYPSSHNLFCSEKLPENPKLNAFHLHSHTLPEWDWNFLTASLLVRNLAFNPYLLNSKVHAISFVLHTSPTGCKT